MTTTTLDRPIPLSVPEELTPEQSAPKRLSEALRAGARFHPQCTGALYDDGKTCALGALLVGLLGPQVAKKDIMRCFCINTIVQQQTGVALTQIVRLPPPHDNERTTLHLALIILNDTHRWTRQRIANWLERLGL